MIVLVKKEKTSMRTTTILTTIAVVTAISILAAPIPKSALAVVPLCQTCGPKEDITGNGIGTLTCSNGASYTNTQISFNAIVPFKTIGPAKGTMTLTATLQTQGMVISGQWDPSAKTYFISGTTTSDNLCGIPGSSFSISGITKIQQQQEVPISMDGRIYSFQGTGIVAASNVKA